VGAPPSKARGPTAGPAGATNPPCPCLRPGRDSRIGEPQNFLESARSGKFSNSRGKWPPHLGPRPTDLEANGNARGGVVVDRVPGDEDFVEAPGAVASVPILPQAMRGPAAMMWRPIGCCAADRDSDREIPERLPQQSALADGRIWAKPRRPPPGAPPQPRTSPGTACPPGEESRARPLGRISAAGPRRDPGRRGFDRQALRATIRSEILRRLSYRSSCRRTRSIAARPRSDEPPPSGCKGRQAGRCASGR